jgi:hypothetical protein
VRGLLIEGDSVYIEGYDVSENLPELFLRLNDTILDASDPSILEQIRTGTFREGAEKNPLTAAVEEATMSGEPLVPNVSDYSK